jgi:Cu-Zn family superoxide dismutase
MQKLAFIALSLAMLLIATGVGRAGNVKPAEAADLTAYAPIRDASGATIGTATFVESGANDVRVTVEITGGSLSAGLHGLHVHATGKCDGPDFATAGGHFNPRNAKHGLQTSDGPHAGDLPNISIGSDGKGRFSMNVSRFTLSPGTLSLMDADGSAIVIHAAVDDGITDATGNSGARVACGVVVMGTPPVVAAAAAPSAPVSAIVAPRTGDAGLATVVACRDC